MEICCPANMKLYTSSVCQWDLPSSCKLRSIEYISQRRWTGAAPPLLWSAEHARPAERMSSCEAVQHRFTSYRDWHLSCVADTSLAHDYRDGLHVFTKLKNLDILYEQAEPFVDVLDGSKPLYTVSLLIFLLRALWSNFHLSCVQTTRCCLFLSNKWCVAVFYFTAEMTAQDESALLQTSS